MRTTQDEKDPCLLTGETFWSSQLDVNLPYGLHFRNYLDQMPYTTMCIKEALRLYPPIPGVSREFSSPVTFPDTALQAAGTRVSDSDRSGNSMLLKMGCA